MVMMVMNLSKAQAVRSKESSTMRAFLSLFDHLGLFIPKRIFQIRLRRGCKQDRI